MCRWCYVMYKRSGSVRGYALLLTHPECIPGKDVYLACIHCQCYHNLFTGLFSIFISLYKYKSVDAILYSNFTSNPYSLRPNVSMMFSVSEDYIECTVNWSL